MAVIGRRTLLASAVAGIAAAAGKSGDPLSVVNRFTTALSGGDAGAAMDAFDKSCPDYEKLSQYFTALTASFAITNEANILDQQDGMLTFDWTLTLSSLATDQTVRREEQVKVDLAQRKNVWKIARFSPVDLFKPDL